MLGASAGLEGTVVTICVRSRRQLAAVVIDGLLEGRGTQLPAVLIRRVTHPSHTVLKLPLAWALARTMIDHSIHFVFVISHVGGASGGVWAHAPEGWLGDHPLKWRVGLRGGHPLKWRIGGLWVPNGSC